MTSFSKAPNPMISPLSQTIGSRKILSQVKELLIRVLIVDLLDESSIYLTVIHPDIVYTINILSQFAPTPMHVVAATRVVRYLKKAPRQGIFLPSWNPLDLLASCDTK
ncbi:Retrovirus-related Pol polyprotein from transposon RE1 [Linum perenne]